MVLVKRRNPIDIFAGVPCSAVAVGTALGIDRRRDIVMPGGLRSDGYLSLNRMNAFIRSHLAVERRETFTRDKRPTLRDFLRTNQNRAIICVLGHYLYADRNTYYSFLKNGDDPVVSVWYLM